MNQAYLDTARLLTQVAPLVLVDDTSTRTRDTLIDFAPKHAQSGRMPISPPIMRLCPARCLLIQKVHRQDVSPFPVEEAAP